VSPVDGQVFLLGEAPYIRRVVVPFIKVGVMLVRAAISTIDAVTKVILIRKKMCEYPASISRVMGHFVPFDRDPTAPFGNRAIKRH